MRSRLVRTLYVLGLTVSAAAVAVPAQARDVKFNVPFTFVVNGETLPPGTYEVTSELSVLLVRGYDHGAAVVTARAESREERDPSLLFNRYGDRYILVEAWMGGDSGRVLPTSRLERQLIETARRESAGNAAGRFVIRAR